MSTVTATRTNTWTKLRNGQWGIKGRNLSAGQVAFVTKRSGERKQVRVDRIIWTGDDGTQIASIKQDAKQAPVNRTDWQRSGRQTYRKQILNGHCQHCGCEAWDCDC